MLFVQDSSQTSCVGVYVNMLKEASKAWRQEPKVLFKYLCSYGEIYKEHKSFLSNIQCLKFIIDFLSKEMLLVVNQTSKLINNKTNCF